MSAMPSSLCVLLLTGAALASAGPIQFISEKLRHSQDAVADQLGLKKPEIGSNPLFGTVIKSINTTCQRTEDFQLINATMDIYTRIFSSILQEQQGAPALLSHLSDSQRSEVESALKYLQQTMERLRSHFNRVNAEKEDLIAKINRIKVDDPMVQKKALAEFKEVYQLAAMVYMQSHQ